MKVERWIRGRFATALAVGLGVVVWLYWPQERPAVRNAPQDRAAAADDASAEVSDGRVSSTIRKLELTPSAREIGTMLHAESGSGDEDNDIVNNLFYDFRKYFQQGNPVGMNEDITAALLGDNPQGLAFLPPDHPAIQDGQIVDRWGTPFWFHSASSNVMEIRSAGPDRKLFTGDDVVLNDTGVEATLYPAEGVEDSDAESGM